VITSRQLPAQSTAVTSPSVPYIDVTRMAPQEKGAGEAGDKEDEDNEREQFPVVLMLPVNGRIVAITDAEGMVGGRASIASFQ
jgi:hypothetical protein